MSESSTVPPLKVLNLNNICNFGAETTDVDISTLPVVDTLSGAKINHWPKKDTFCSIYCVYVKNIYCVYIYTPSLTLTY